MWLTSRIWKQDGREIQHKNNKQPENGIVFEIHCGKV